MNTGPVSNDIGASVLPWRFTTPLHKNDGARCISGSVNTISGQPVQILAVRYSPLTIDRVIGVRLVNPNINVFGPAGAQQLHLAGEVYEAVTGYYFPWNFTNGFVSAFFNTETAVDGINLNITTNTTGTLYYSLYNFEIGQSLTGR